MYHHVSLVVVGGADVSEDHGTLGDFFGLLDHTSLLGELRIKMNGEDNRVSKLAALATPLQDGGSHPLRVVFLQKADGEPICKEMKKDSLEDLLLVGPHHPFICSEEVLQRADMTVHELFKPTFQLQNRMSTAEDLEGIYGLRPS